MSFSHELAPDQIKVLIAMYKWGETVGGPVHSDVVAERAGISGQNALAALVGLRICNLVGIDRQQARSCTTVQSSRSDCFAR